MRNFLLVVLFFLACAPFVAEALQGKPLYDYMVLFLNTYWDDVHWKPAVDSILASDNWKVLDAQYGPYVHPTAAPTTAPAK